MKHYCVHCGKELSDREVIVYGDLCKECSEQQELEDLEEDLDF